MTPNFEKIEADLYKLFKEVEPSIDTTFNKETTKQFIDVGEYGLAFEDICYWIIDKNIVISDEEKKAIRSLAEAMLIDPKVWAEIVRDSPEAK